MPFITAVVGLLNADGSNPVPAKSDGTREAPVIVLGDGLSFAGDIRGRVTLTATSSFSGTINDTQHGARGRTLDGTAGTDPLHALATTVLPGFLSAAYATNLGFYTGQVAPGSVGQFGIDAAGAGVQWWEPGATAPGRSAGNRLAGRRMEHVFVAGPGETWHASDGETISIVGGGGNDVILPTTIQPHMVVVSCDASGTAVVNPGANTIMGGAGAATIGSLGAEAWLLVLETTGNWLRFIAA